MGWDMGQTAGLNLVSGRGKGMGLAAALLSCLILAGCEREAILEGERFGTDVPLSETFGDAAPAQDADASAGDAPRAISLPGASQLADWSMRGYSATNRLPHAALSGNLTNIWTADIGRGNSRRNRITADPVAADGRVFTMDAMAGVVATSLSTGGALWSANLEPGFDRGGSVSGGGLAVAGGRLYASTGFGELVAMDAATGGILWRQRLDAGIGSPTIVGDRVYIVSRNNQAWVLNTANGRVEYQIPSIQSGALLSGGAAPAVGDGLVVFAFGSGELMGVSQSTGTQRWVSTVAGGRSGVAYANINDITSDPVIAGGAGLCGQPIGSRGGARHGTWPSNLDVGRGGVFTGPFDWI